MKCIKPYLVFLLCTLPFTACSTDGAGERPDDSAADSSAVGRAAADAVVGSRAPDASASPAPSVSAESGQREPGARSGGRMEPERAGAAQRGDPPADTSYQVDRVITPQPLPTSARARVTPVDEAGQDPALVAYRMRFLEVVGRRDAEAVYDFMSENVMLSFGGTSGREGFREMWRPGHPDTEVWGRLGQVLGGGGLYETGSFELANGRRATARFRAPYYFAAFPGDRFDAFQHGVLLAPDVPIRREPRSEAPVMNRLAFAIVRVPNFKPYEGETHDWIRVQTGDEQFGYVRSDLIASPVGYRAVFHRIDGEWTMTSFVAGD